MHAGGAAALALGWLACAQGGHGLGLGSSRVSQCLRAAMDLQRVLLPVKLLLGAGITGRWCGELGGSAWQQVCRACNRRAAEGNPVVRSMLRSTTRPGAWIAQERSGRRVVGFQMPRPVMLKLIYIVRRWPCAARVFTLILPEVWHTGSPGGDLPPGDWANGDQKCQQGHVDSFEVGGPEGRGMISHQC